MSTGYGATNQSTLESDLSIESGKLDQSMASLDNPSQIKSAINATEGSGVKLTGYAYEGDQVSFNYTLSSNDYIPYNDFAFVQVKTGDSLGTSPSIKTSLKSLGSIGLDVVDKGSKSGSFTYTFTKEDFNNNKLI